MSDFPQLNLNHARRRHNIHYPQSNIDHKSPNTTSLVNFASKPSLAPNSCTQFEKPKYEKTVKPTESNFSISQTPDTSASFSNFSSLFATPATQFWNSAQVILGTKIS